MKEKICVIILSVIIAFMAPISLLFIELSTASPYTKTYYAQLSSMYQKLKTTEEKKVILVGNSSVVFGIDSALMEQELKACGVEYKVCNFGLYGALGTQLMLDISEEYIGEDDIVVFMPEPYGQAFSLYFSAQETWRAMDKQRDIFWDLSQDSRKRMIGAYPSFIAEKTKYAKTGDIVGDGVYGKDSFDENGDFKNVARPYNTMLKGYDANNLIYLEEALFENNFCDYVKSYQAKVEEKGATAYFALAPLNQVSVVADAEKIEEFCISARKNFSMEILGEPLDSVMQAEWFYDSNFHLNDAGMTVYTAMLTESIKTKLGIGKPSGIILPTMPDLPNHETNVEGDNSQADCFVYEENGDGYTVVGLSELGMTKSSLIVPTSYNGKPITELAKTTFQGNQLIESVTLQANISRIMDDSFSGCTSLRKIILQHTSPTEISIGWGLLNGTEDCKVYVNTKYLSAFHGDYVWGFYIEYMGGYDE